MIKNISLLVIVFTIIFSGCKDNSTNPSNPKKDIMPLKIGNQWLYTTTEYDSNGQANKVHIDTLIVLKDTTIGSEKWYVFQTNSETISYVTLRSDGFYAMSKDTAKNLIPYLVYKYPAITGDKFIRKMTYFQDTVSVMSTSKATSSDAGTFTCYQYQTISEQTYYFFTIYFRSNEYISPAVGMVKNETYTKRTDGTEYLETSMILKSYTLK